MRCKIAIVLSAIAAVVLLTSGPASAQSAGDAAGDLRSNNVTYEDGAPGLTPNELDRLDNTAANLQSSNAFFKVAVLAEPVSDFSTPREFAQTVLRNLGGTGRVLVFDSERVGIASNAGDSAEAINRAEQAASDETNRQQSYAEGVEAAADVLGTATVPGGGGTGSGGGSGGESSGSSSGGSSAWIWAVLVIGALVIGGLFLWSRMRKARSGGSTSTVNLGEGEMKIRSHQDRAGNLVLELADRVEQPGAPAESKQLFQQGASEFAELQDDLEQADTRPELEAVYPRIVDAVWKLESSKALLDGGAAPAKPADELLFPAPAPPPVPAAPASGPMAPVDVGQQYQPVPEPSGYRSMGSSPWLTTAATAALSMLAGRMMAPDRSYRPPANDDIFFGGGSGGGRRRRGGGGGGINLGGGSGGRGMGRRR